MEQALGAKCKRCHWSPSLSLGAPARWESLGGTKRTALQHGALGGYGREDAASDEDCRLYRWSPGLSHGAVSAQIHQERLHGASATGVGATFS